MLNVLVTDQYRYKQTKIPTTPPLLENVLFVTDITQKAQLFNGHFMLQCTTIDNGSNIPYHTSIIPTRIDSAVISNEKILKIIRLRYPNNSHR